MDLSLCARIRAGHPQAFASLFDDHPQAVYSHGARLTGDRSTAEDVVSLTFLEAWRLRTKLLPDAEFSDGTGDGLRPWLFGIATNLLRNKTPNDSQPPVQHSGIYAGRSGTSSHCASGRG